MAQVENHIAFTFEITENSDGLYCLWLVGYDERYLIDKYISFKDIYESAIDCSGTEPTLMLWSAKQGEHHQKKYYEGESLVLSLKCMQNNEKQKEG